MSRFPNCSVKDCDSVALMQAVVLIWKVDQKPHEHEPVKVLLDFKACARCKNQYTLGDLVDDDCFDKICKMFEEAGAKSPDRATTKLDWTSIQGKRF